MGEKNIQQKSTLKIKDVKLIFKKTQKLSKRDVFYEEVMLLFQKEIILSCLN